MRDTSSYAATPALGYAANMISTCVVIFLGLVAFIFWLGGLAEHAIRRAPAELVPEREPVIAPAGSPVAPQHPARAPGD
jgi:hypothetical protein